MKRWQTITLITSLVLNLVLVGFIAGHAVRGMRHPPFAPFGFGMAHMIDALPAARRAELQPLVRESFRALQPHLAEMRSLQANIDQALLTEPFDADELARRLAAMRTNMDTAQISSHAALVRITTQLTHAERVQLAAALREPPWRMRGRHAMRFSPPDAPPDSAR